jgi:hypothetical protein
MYVHIYTSYVSLDIDFKLVRVLSFSLFVLYQSLTKLTRDLTY